MLEILFTFFLSFFVLSVCWFLPSAGTADYQDPTRKEILVIAILAAIPASMAAIMF